MAALVVGDYGMRINGRDDSDFFSGFVDGDDAPMVGIGRIPRRPDYHLPRAIDIATVCNSRHANADRFI